MFRPFIVLIVGMILSSFVVRAQQAASPPIIGILDGDLMAFQADGSSTVAGSRNLLLNYDALKSSVEAHPVEERDVYLSPDGLYLVYRVTPLFFIQAMNAGLTGNLGDSPNDLVLLDLKTLDTTPLTSHQPGTTYTQTGRLHYHGRWAVAWSPDSRQVAYIDDQSNDVSSPDYRSKLVVYDVASGQSRTLAEGSEPQGSKLTWMPDGLLADTTLYDPNLGAVLAQNFLNGNAVIQQQLTYLGRDYVSVASTEHGSPKDQVYVFDILTGQYGLAPGYVSSVSLNAPDTSLVLVDNTNDTRPAYVYDRSRSQVIFTPPRQPPYAANFTLSPDGNSFAYVSLDIAMVVVDRQGNQQPTDVNGWAINWGPMMFTIVLPGAAQASPVQPTEDFFSVSECGSLRPVGLTPGGQGRVLPGSPNRIRSRPDPNAPQIGQIPGGAVFDVALGQQDVCHGGIRWAQIRYQGVSGWTAEGADGQPFIQPE